MKLNKLNWHKGLFFIIAISLNQNTIALDELDCIIKPEKIIEISSATAGLLESVLVEKGDKVKKNQLLAHLHSEIEKANVKLAEIRANSKANIMEKQARYQFNLHTQTRLENLFKKKMISELERDEARTKTTIAQYELEQAKVNYQLAQSELKRAQEILKWRSIWSPIDGIVIEKIKSPGEYVHVVDEEPVLKLAKMDMLYVEVIAPISMYDRIKKGMSANVIPEAPIGSNYVAKVKIIDPIMDAASGTFGIRLHLPNEDYSILAGLRCRIEFIEN